MTSAPANPTKPEQDEGPTPRERLLDAYAEAIADEARGAPDGAARWLRLRDLREALGVDLPTMLEHVDIVHEAQRQANDAAYSVTRHTQFPADDPRREQQQAEREQARQRGRDAIEQLGELAPHVMACVPGLVA